ncbi:MAG: hypothetical protein NVS3B12_09680 [Acidimicrobiales bacterium]
MKGGPTLAAVGDRVEVGSQKGSARTGTVTATVDSMITVQWDSGGTTSLIPGPGVVTILPGRRRSPAKTSPPAGKSTTAKTVGTPKKGPNPVAPIATPPKGSASTKALPSGAAPAKKPSAKAVTKTSPTKTSPTKTTTSTPSKAGAVKASKAPVSTKAAKPAKAAKKAR